MKDLSEPQFILRVKVFRDHKSKKIVLSQATYIDKLMVKYVIWTLRRVCYLFGIEYLFLKINVLRHMRRKIA